MLEVVANIAAARGVLLCSRSTNGNPFHLERSLREGGTTTSDIDKAKNAALRYLTFRPRTRKEIFDKLTELGYESEIVQSTIATLERLKLVDDLEFSLQWAESRIRHNPKSPWMIAQELRKKGVSPQTIEKALDEAFAEVDLADLAVQLLRKQFARRTYRIPDRNKIKKRMLDFLKRRGFGQELAWNASEQILLECFDKGNDEV